jgi:hypothetical protein
VRAQNRERSRERFARVVPRLRDSQRRALPLLVVRDALGTRQRVRDHVPA